MTFDTSTESFIYGDPPHGHDSQSDEECREFGPGEKCNYYIRTKQDVLFDFSATTEDDTIADFGPRSRYESKSINRSLRALEEIQGLDEMLLKPCQVIQIGKHVNDIYLLNLSIDSTRKSFRFDWKAMLSLFFFEEYKWMLSLLFFEEYKCLLACREWVKCLAYYCIPPSLLTVIRYIARCGRSSCEVSL